MQTASEGRETHTESLQLQADTALKKKKKQRVKKLKEKRKSIKQKYSVD